MSAILTAIQPDNNQSVRAGYLVAKNTVKLKRLTPLNLSGLRQAVPDRDDPAAYPDDLTAGLGCDLSAREAVVDAESALAGRMFEATCAAADLDRAERELAAEGFD